jgi:hypothetical protein
MTSVMLGADHIFPLVVTFILIHPDNNRAVQKRES